MKDHKQIPLPLSEIRWTWMGNAFASISLLLAMVFSLWVDGGHAIGIRRCVDHDVKQNGSLSAGSDITASLADDRAVTEEPGGQLLALRHQAFRLG